MSNNSNSNHQNNRRYRLPSEDLESIDLSNDNLLTTPLKNHNSNNKNKVKKRSTIHLARKAYEKCTCTQLLCFFCSCTGLCIGLTLLFFGQSFLQMYKQDEINKQVIISSPEAEGFKSWRNSSEKSQRYVNAYIFNVTNPYEVLKHGAKVHVEEIGPFVFKAEKVKLNISWNKNNDTVTYREWTHHIFDQDATKNALITSNKKKGKQYNVNWNDTNVRFTVVNGFFWGMRPQAGDAVWNLYFEKYSEFDKMFSILSVDEIINGYGEGIFKFPGLQPNQLKPGNAPPPHTVYVGEKYPDLIGQFVKWKNMGPELKVQCPWEDTFYKNTCTKSKFPCCGGTSNVWQHVNSPLPKAEAAGQPNVIMGGDGSKFKRGNHSRILIFVDPIVRHVLFYRQKEPLIHKGVSLVRYEIPIKGTRGLENASQFPFNNAYYMFGPKGIQNGTMNEKGAPIYFSLPHFIGVGKEAADRVTGLTRKNEKLTTTIGVEPTLGLTFFASQALQINVQIETAHLSDGTTWFPNVMKGKTYVPLAWIQQTSGSSDAAANEWLGILHLLFWANIGILGFGFLFTAISLFSILKTLFGYFSEPKLYSDLDDGREEKKTLEDIVRGD